MHLFIWKILLFLAVCLATNSPEGTLAGVPKMGVELPQATLQAEAKFTQRPPITKAYLDQARRLRSLCGSLGDISGPDLGHLLELANELTKPITKQLEPILLEVCRLTLLQILSKPEDHKSLLVYNVALSILNTLQHPRFISLKIIWTYKGGKLSPLITDLMPEKIVQAVNAEEDPKAKELLQNIVENANLIKQMVPFVATAE